MRTAFTLKLFFAALALLSSLKALGQVAPVVHSIQGRVQAEGTYRPGSIKVSLAGKDNISLGSKALGYEGTFSFEGLSAGDYLLSIELPDGVTSAHSIHIGAYPTPKVFFLDIRLNRDASNDNVSEHIKEAADHPSFQREEEPSKVSLKALKEFKASVAESEKGNPQKAIDHLLRAIKETPDYYEAYTNLGAQYQKLQQWEPAIQAYQKAIVLRSESAMPHLNLGGIYWKQRRLDAAIAEYKLAAQFDPRLALAQKSLGMLYFLKKEYRAAEPCLETATRLSPKESREAFLLLIQIQMGWEKYERARFFLDQFFEYFPSDSEGLKLQESLSSRPPERNLP